MIVFYLVYGRLLVNNIFGFCLSLGKLADRVKAGLQRRSNQVYFGLSPKNKSRVGRAFRGSKKTRSRVEERAVKGKRAIHRMVLGSDKSFKEVLVHGPGGGRSRVKKLVVGKSGGSIKVERERR